MNVAIIGAGVIGLSTGIELLERGDMVTIFARELPPSTTSDVAAAFWFPFRVFPADRAIAWGRKTFRRLEMLAKDDSSGVWMAPLEMLHHVPQGDPWWASAVDEFRVETIGRESPRWHGGRFHERISLTVPLIDTSIHMPYLVDEFLARGGTLEERELSTLEMIPSSFDAVACCLGVFARQLLGDERVHPIRGQVVRVKRPAGVPHQAFTAHEENQVTYVVVRDKDAIFGGTADIGDWDLTPRPEISENIIRRCSVLVPACANAEIIESRVGLRPGRDVVRLERETLSDGRPIVYNYGHGGAGFTLSWGCAAEVAELLAKAS